tara:strand:- start:510 stop:1538 length:1029 start_codon:yes stop_codon:yes gene_type:complete
LFLRKRRAYWALIVFFAIGAAVGGYLGSPSTNDSTAANKSAPIDKGRPQHSQVSQTPKSNVGVKVYAYKTPIAENRTPLGQSPKKSTAKSERMPKVTAPRSKPVPLAEEIVARTTEKPDATPVAYIAIVIDDLGIDQKRTQKTIALTAPLTLAFLPYGYNLRQLSSEAAAAGHELIVHLPMQPSLTDVDPGPNALLRGLSEDEIRERIAWNLSQFEGYVGINNHMGSAFSTWDEGMTVVLQELRDRGLFFLDSLTSPNSAARRVAAAEGMDVLVRDVFLDNEANIDHVAERLAELEGIARRRGFAIGIGHPYDATTDALSAWLPTLREQGFELVPLSRIRRR